MRGEAPPTETRPGDGPARKVFVHTFGCQMNVYDSLRMVQVLGEADAGGFVATQDPAEADLILVNTCSVRDKPFQKVRHTVGRYAQLRRDKPDLLIGVTGCVAAQEGARLLEWSTPPDLVLGPDALSDLPRVVDRARTERRAIVDAAHRPVADYSFLEAYPLGDEGVTAMVTAMKGCDNFCSYCIVPFVRGREVSKPSAQILREVQRHLDTGVREVMLLGQNVNRFGLDRQGREPGEELSFAGLLRTVGALPGLERLRFTTSHPKDCSDDLIACFGDVAPLCEYFHLPFQAGSDDVLKRMNRGYDRAWYLDRVERLRAVSPDIHLSADVIVGFPGESDADFEQTLDILERVRFGSLFSFKYSPRPGTAAARLDDDVPETTKVARLRAVQELQERCSADFLATYQDREVEVLVEGLSRDGRRGDRLQIAGRTRTNVIVNLSAPSPEEAQRWVGRFVRVRVDRVRAHSLGGTALSVEPWDAEPRDAEPRDAEPRNNDMTELTSTRTTQARAEQGEIRHA